MRIAADIIIALVALEHAWFLVLEMFLWTQPIGLKTFHLTPEFAAASQALAMNQGLYNGFLAAGLIWGLLSSDPASLSIKTFFLACVVVAGIFGAATVNIRILFLQGVPALLALALLRLAR